MDSRLQLELARARAQDLRVARIRVRAHAGDGPPAIPATTPVTLRYAFPDDADALARLATLDSSMAPAMPVLLAEAGGELRAALSLIDGAVVADPFHPSVALVDLLRTRAAQLTTAESAPRRPLRSIRATFRARLRVQSDR